MSPLNYFTAANFPAAVVNPFPTPTNLSTPEKGSTWVCVRQFGLDIGTGTNCLRFGPGDWVIVPASRVSELRADQMIY